MFIQWIQKFYAGVLWFVIAYCFYTNWVLSPVFLKQIKLHPLSVVNAIQVVLPVKSCSMYLKTYLPQRWQLALYTTKLYFLHFFICYHKTKTHIALQSVYLTINNAKFTYEILATMYITTPHHSGCGIFLSKGGSMSIKRTMEAPGF